MTRVLGARILLMIDAAGQKPRQLATTENYDAHEPLCRSRCARQLPTHIEKPIRQQVSLNVAAIRSASEILPRNSVSPKSTLLGPIRPVVQQGQPASANGDLLDVSPRV